MKEAAPVLGVSQQRITQSLDPALTKIAKLWRACPTRTMQAILDAVDRLPEPTHDETDVQFQRLAAARPK